MPKLGRRPWVRRQRAKWRAEAGRARVAAALWPEAIIAIEVGLDSFHRYRTSDEWQALGWGGRWLGAWRVIGRGGSRRVIGRGGSRSDLSAMAEIYRRVYSDAMVSQMAALRSTEFRMFSDPNVPRGKAFVVSGFGLLLPPSRP